MKLFKIFLCAAFAAITLTSCLGDDDTENTYTAYGYYTIVGSQTTGYTLYSDTGGKVIPSSTSVYDVTGGHGFGNHTRALFYFNYKPSQVSQDQSTITGADLYDGRYFDELKPLSLAEAETALVNSTDSVFQYQSLVDAWAYRGYLNTVVNGQYSQVNTVSIMPTVNLVYDPASITDNSITFDIYYNRHTAQDAAAYGPVNLYTSYFLDDLDALIPGSGDVRVILRGKDGATKMLTVSRQNFHKGNYE